MLKYVITYYLERRGLRRRTGAFRGNKFKGAGGGGGGGPAIGFDGVRNPSRIGRVFVNGFDRSQLEAGSEAALGDVEDGGGEEWRLIHVGDLHAVVGERGGGAATVDGVHEKTYLKGGRKYV